MRVHSYTGPFREDGSDYDTLDINIRVEEDPKPGWVDGVHWGMIKVHGDAVPLALAILKFFNVEENQL